MASDTETTALVGHQSGMREQSYLTLDSRRSSTTTIYDPALTKLSVEELLYRFQYAFLDNTYDVEADVSAVLFAKTDTERALAEDEILQALNKTPLAIQQKLAVLSLLRGETQPGRDRVKRNQQTPAKKQKILREYRGFHLWEDAITKLTAYFGSNVASYFRFLRALMYLNLLLAFLMVGLITVPQLISGDTQTNVTYDGHFGDLSNSLLFYGAYTDRPMKDYNLQLAYFLTWIAANLGCFVLVITVMIIRYRKSKLAEKGEEYPFAWRSFCTWDHSISSPAGARDQRKAIKTDLKEVVREEQSKVKVSVCKRLLFYLGRLVSNVLVLALMGGSGVLIYYVANEEILPDTAPDSLKTFFTQYQLPIVVAGLKLLVPPLFHLLVRLEGWAPRVEAKWTLTRTTVFYFASLMVFVTSLYRVAGSCSPEKDTQQEAGLHGNLTCCWENEIAEEVFKVVLLDLAICLLVGLCFHMGRAAAVKCRCLNRKIGYSTFDVISCVLDLVYGQGLIWLGLYFSPLLSVVAVVKLFIVFYFRYIVAKVAMVPSQELFRASSTGNFYLAILLCNLFISLFPMAYAVIELEPSQICGPFRMRDRAYDVLTETVGNLPDWLETALNYVSTPAIIVPIVILLVMVAVYYKSKSASYDSLITELRKQLKFERRVEKRKVFATGKAMSAVSLSKTSLTNLDEIPTTPSSAKKLWERETIVEDDEFRKSLIESTGAKFDIDESEEEES